MWWTDCAEMLWRGPGWQNKQLIKFWWLSASSVMSKWARNTIIVLSCPNQVAGNDPKALELAFHQGPTLTDAYCRVDTNLVDWDWGLSKHTFCQPRFLSPTWHPFMQQAVCWVMICLSFIIFVVFSDNVMEYIQRIQGERHTSLNTCKIIHSQMVQRSTIKNHLHDQPRSAFYGFMKFF